MNVPTATTSVGSSCTASTREAATDWREAEEADYFFLRNILIIHFKSKGKVTSNCNSSRWSLCDQLQRSSRIVVRPR